MAKTISGIAASSGIAIAKAFILEDPVFDIDKKTTENTDREIERLMAALEASKQQLTAIKEKAHKELGADKAEIFAAHILVLDDPEFVGAVKDQINNEMVNAESATNDVANHFITMFEQMDNEYMKERAADIRDVSKRVLAHLLDVQFASPASITEEVVIVAKDLTPSDTAQLNRQFVQGFATDIGGRTSHSAIMSRSMEIPAVVGTKEVTADISNDTLVIIDGIEGEVIIDPSQDQIDTYKQKQADFEKEKQELAKLAGEPSVTKDDHRVELAANIGTPQDVEGALNNGAEGIGLYRTEFLYMDRDQLPTEDEQFDAYKTVLEKMDGKPVVIRTLDVGGDKELPYLDLPEELNPFLGFRAIRLCLEKQDMFRTQLRALLRASAYGNLKVMFPMIATLDEFRQAKQLLEEEKQALVSKGVEVSTQIEVGIMVEIPSTAVMADRFAKEVDFFSIGTNDLIQYTLASDRMNEKVSYLYQPYNPAILRLVKNVIDAAHKEGKWTGMCGEMAGDAVAIPILLGLGLHEFSMSATSVLPARNQLASLSKEEATGHIDTILNMDTADEVEQFVKKNS